MERLSRVLMGVALAVSPLFCEAQAPVVLGKCLVENLLPKDRGDLARWVFLSMSTHRDMRQFSKASGESREDTARAVGDLFTRLMTHDCVAEVQEAARTGGTAVVPSAIQFLTQIGIQELMTSRDVLDTLSTFSRFADKERIDGASGRR